MKQKRWKTDGYLRIFASYYRPHWKLFALDMVCALCICLVDLAFPIVSRFSMQTLLPGQMFTAFFVVMAVLGLRAQGVLLLYHHLLGASAGGTDGGRHTAGSVLPHAGSVLFLL